ncbi:MAG TPA: LacI family DNA-binding transcriptional regulator [Rhodopila sp.]|jgi:LacI family transcriptional regulator|nr:LacI family DNA-binding transcriptional regulator [Rhodopila sp.]
MARVTVTDVAKAAGVHPSTVSRALKPETRSLLTEEVATRVLAVAAQLGYHRNTFAAGLRTRRSEMVGVVLPDMTNPVFQPILRGIEEALDAEGLVAIVANAGTDPDRQRSVIQRLLARQVDGLILATAARRETSIDLCLAENVPVVLVNRNETTHRACSVITDDAAGMGLAVTHLRELGHTCIGHLGGPQTASTGAGRLKGFTDAMTQAGLDPTSTVAATAFTREAGEPAATRLLNASPDLSAVVAANDLLALGLYDVLRTRRLRCPDDISVVGHNDMPLVDMIAPPLTTIRIRHREMGLQAARLMLDLMRKTSEGVVDIVLRPELIVRASTAAR